MNARNANLRSIRSLFVISAATLAVASIASAQYRVDNSNARDANNRLGSGGINTGAPGVGGVNTNYVVTGNVTAGQAFRGTLGYTDPTAFRGRLGSASFDPFIRNSSGITTGGTPSFNASTARPFYGANTVSAPAGYVQNISPGAGVNYVQAPNAIVQPYDGRIDFGGATRAQIAQSLTQQVQLMRATSVVPTAQAGSVGGVNATSFSPGAINSPMIGGGDPYFNLSEYTALRRLGATNNLAAGAAVNTAPGTRNNPGSDPSATGSPGSGVTPGTFAPAAGGTANDPTALKPAEPRKDPTGTTGQQSSISRPPINGDPRNAQLAALRNQYKLYDPSVNALPGSDAANQIAATNAQTVKNQAKPADNAAPDNAAPNGAPGNAAPGNAAPGNAAPNGAAGAPGSTVVPPGGTATPTDPNLPRPIDAVPPKSVVVTSFADGIESADVKDTVLRAEAAMKKGNFKSAYELFDQARAKAPGDSVIFMGRSVAELGDGLYRRAELSLREAFTAEPALAGGEYDLKGMLGTDRLNVIVRDLKANARRQPNDPGPLMVLAFVYRNTGNVPFALEHLRRAADVSGNTDEQVKLLTRVWSAASASPAGEPSK